MTPESLAHLLRPITQDQALHSYRQLRDTDAPMAGLKTLDRHFFPERLQTKTKGRGHLSFYDAFHSPDTVEHLRTLCRRYKRNHDNPSHQYMVFQIWYGSVNQFRPRIAQCIYRHLSPKVGVLDFSAGWGGRALGAMSLDIPYIGIDANRSLAPYYNALLQYEPTASLQMIFQPSETIDFSQFQYDCVFTSPPYFTQEVYPHMPAYPTLQDFLSRFLVPVIHRVWTHLQTPGSLALNLPTWLYDRLTPLLSLPPLTERLPMPYNTRFRKDKPSTSTEWIYVWLKST